MTIINWREGKIKGIVEVYQMANSPRPQSTLQYSINYSLKIGHILEFHNRQI